MRTTGTVHSADHLARFVWHRDPTIRADRNRTGVSNPGAQLRGNELSRGLCSTKRLFQTHSHVSGAGTALPYACARIRSETK